jgi:hypothetical protein
VAGTKFKKRDMNRYRKVYPYLRKSPKYRMMSDKRVQLEVGQLSFSSDAEATFTFAEPFEGQPYVTIIAVDSEGNDSADVNAYIKTVNTKTVTIGVSQAFTGVIHIHSIWIEG